MMRFEYDPKFIKLLAKEMVKEMQKVCIIRPIPVHNPGVLQAPSEA